MSNKDKQKTKQMPLIPYEDCLESDNGGDSDQALVLDFYNANRGNLSRCIKLTPIRKKQISARVKQVGLEELLKILSECFESKFLQGDNNRGWKPDLEWLTKDSNFTKILEGKYVNKDVGATNTKRVSRFD